ncbi:MAG TPA: cytochrome c oxidase assembly protein, partial [Solirubrobacteraceae bacterium]|nr:cytochrome c oxidase assembly protein [Solirubrobacteraceae bacterium]
MPVEVSWSFAPVVIASLVAYAVVYGLRWRTVRREGGARAAGVGRAVLWGAGIATLAVALLSPVDHLGEQFATFHMVQHLLIADLAPIFLTLGLTKWLL